MFTPPVHLLLDLVGAGVLLLLTISCATNLTTSVLAPDRQPHDSKLYADKDGTATEESQKKYSVRTQNLVLGTATSVGTALSVPVAVLSITDRRGDLWPNQGRLVTSWLQFGIWVLLSLQTASILRDRDSRRRYKSGINVALSHLMQFALLGLTNWPLVWGTVPQHARLTFALAIAQAVLAFIAFVTCLSYPRRPAVYHRNHIVDGQETVSFIERYTYSWPAGLLEAATEGRQLDAKDLPRMDHHLRAEDLHDRAMLFTKQNTLFKLLIRSHASGFIRQFSFTVMNSLFLVAPQFAMYQLLKLLEARDKGASIGVSALLWVLALGAAMLVLEFSEAAMWWVSYGELCLAVRVQLSALIYNKSMRKKDVKDTGRGKKTDEPIKGDLVEAGAIDDNAEDTETPGMQAEDNLQKTRQGTINLVGVDAKRISDFTSFNHLLYASVIKLAVSFTFLNHLIGWQGLLAGVSVQLFFLPVNIYFSKRYADAQDDLMKMRDRKLAVLSEALNGIRQIKFSALERQWQERIGEVRNKELSIIWRSFCSDTMLIFCWLIGPVLLSATSIGVYSVIHGSLNASVAFTTIAILIQIEGTLAYIPELTTYALDALISLRRIEEYLNSADKPQNTVPGDTVSLKNATIAWPMDSDLDNEDAFKLHGVTLDFPTGELSVISGRTGSGKSLLLASILGEVEVLDGSIIVPVPPAPEDRYDHLANKSNWILPSAVAFVSQIPWIENATFKDNVLFGLPFDETRYKDVISACALDKDLHILEDGDLTEIGANGINLSGGQRWRITLARALYSRAGILVLDDIFSAVDAHVGRHIFEHALTGELSEGRTRILVTHHVSLCLPKTKYEVRLSDGKVEHAGFVEQLKSAGILQDIIAREDQEIAVTDDDIAAELPDLARVSSRRRSSHRRGSNLSTQSATIQQANGDAVLRERRPSSTSIKATDNDGNGIVVPNGKAQPKVFVKEESRHTGRVAWSVYASYMQACGGWPFWTGIFLMYGFYQGLILGRAWWLKLWTEHGQSDAFLLHVQSFSHKSLRYDPSYTADGISPDLKYYLTIYVVISVTMCIQGTTRYLLMFSGSVRASRTLFDNLTYAVLRAPLRWLDTVPVGRILNRFTADFNIVDSSIANSLAFGLFNVLMLVCIIVAGIMVSPIILVFAVVLLGVCVRHAFYFLNAARETKRIESTAKSPIFELFATSLAGVASLRAFGKSQVYIDRMYDRIDAHACAGFYMFLLNRWLAWRLGVIGALFAVSTAGIIISLPRVNAPLGGFALAFMLDYTHTVVWVLRQYANLELGMNAAERIKEFSEIPIEDEGGIDAPAAWPSEGKVEVNDLVVGYAPDLPAVLRGLTFSVERNQRVGVVGRTGAGKSSLTLALFRFLEARAGTVHIDGLDISKIKLHDLRSRLAIIPQDPVLFSGTVRSNLDPFSEHNDYELRDALERVHLVSASGNESDGDSASGSEANVNIFNSLTSSIGEGGLNLSQGQRQLLCLARAIVARPKVMVLDEATSAVDKRTDELIQQSIREEFSDSTLIVIAHRLSTIADFDRILVMSEGVVAEYDAPRNLLEKKGGVFASMVEDSGERELLRQIILGSAAS